MPRAFTRERLERFDGTGGRPAYLAYRGQVHDLTNSFLRMKGRHQALYEAGRDLPKALEEVPLGTDLLERVPVIGTLSEGPA